MAQISKTAGMSIGHIYHYFESKEAIIAALVERDSVELIELLEGYSAQSDVAQAMVDGVGRAYRRDMVREDAALRLEFFAEAARNPKVEAIMREAERLRSSPVLEALNSSDPQRGEDDWQARLKLVIALFHGLTIRAACGEAIDPELAVPHLQRAIAALLKG